MELLDQHTMVPRRPLTWKTTKTVDELRQKVYFVVFDIRGEAEGYDNIGDILQELK